MRLLQTKLRGLVGLLAGFFLVPAFAVIELYEFDTQEQSALYHELAKELRCVVCQNQNLLESNAPIAKDLRQQVYQMVRYENADKQQVIRFMVQRYGDFVLYRPPVQPNTWILWFAPLLMLLLAIGLTVSFVRRSQQAAKELEG